MAPVKMNKDPKAGVIQQSVTTRSQVLASAVNKITNKSSKAITANEKRKADCSPLKKTTKRSACSPSKKTTTKRSAFSDLTNVKITLDQLKKGPTTKGAHIRLKDERLTAENTRNLKQKSISSKVGGPALSLKVGGPALDTKNPTIKCYGKLTKPTVALKSKLPVNAKVAGSSKATLEEEVLNITASIQRISSDSSDTSLYVTAVEEIGDENIIKVESSKTAVDSQSSVSQLPQNVPDFDAENWIDPIQVSNYAMDIFNYLKEKEAAFCVDNYMVRQMQLSQWMRALLVDWMVEVQESFELNHETLYLAVKMVDLYLAKTVVAKEMLQLIGAAAIFIASKYDERMPPLIDDFLYICDGAYTKAELMRMEINIVQTMDYNLGIPLSYRFLRRYARCAKVSMPTLTLARYILEFSLMEYSFVMTSESKLAAAALLLALKMKDISSWTPTLNYYSGYKLDDIKDVTHLLNEMLHKKPKDALATIRNKYSHRIFFEVAKLPLLDTLTL